MICFGNARIVVEIEVAAILARSKDRVGEGGGSRREQEWQEPRSRAKRAEATDAAAARAGTRSIVGHRGDLRTGVRRGRNASGARRVVRAALRPSGGAPGAALRARAETRLSFQW